MNDTQFTYRTAPFLFEATPLSEAVYRKTKLLRRLWRYGKRGAREHRFSLLIGLGANLFTILWQGIGDLNTKPLWAGVLVPFAFGVVHTLLIWSVVAGVLSILLGIFNLHGRRGIRARRQKNLQEHLPGITKALSGLWGAQSPSDRQGHARVEIEDATITMDKTGKFNVRVGPKKEGHSTESIQGTKTEYADLRGLLRKQRWDASRLSVLKSHPLSGMSTDAAIQILETFDWDDGKLRALKLLKPWMMDAADQGYKIAAAFDFGSGVESAMEILRS